MIQRLLTIKEWLFGDSLIVYIACRMTGRDRAEMVHRAKFVVDVLAQNGIKGISPVLEEGVKPDHSKLINNDRDRLAHFWARDKYIIRRISHAVLFDHAEMTSFGMTREYCLNRGVLWKPTVVVVAPGTPVSVAPFEDDLIVTSAHSAAIFLRKMYGSRMKRWSWRMRMINRSLPRWVFDQLVAWR